MNKVIIRGVTIVDPASNLNRKVVDAVIVNGVFNMEPVKDLSDFVQIDGAGFYLSPGWIDAMAFCGEPGEEWKETVESLTRAASMGGFTSVAALCGNHPFPDKASAIAALKANSKKYSAKLLPLGAATKNMEGKEMAELYDMRESGAIAFTDGCMPIEDSGLKSRIMEYSNNCQVPFIDFCHDQNLAPLGMMHDGAMSNSLGLKGIPSIAEENALSTSIRLAKWLNTPLRIFGISTAGSVSQIRKAKKEGLNILAAVPIMNLLYEDNALHDFDENYKVLPPLRTAADRKAIIEGLLDGTIDVLVSNHQPQDPENKSVEFEYAAFGAANLQVMFGMAIKALGKDLSNELLVNLFYHGPSKFLGMSSPALEVNYTGDYTLFSENGSWFWDAISNGSKSTNSPLFNTEVSGTIAGTICHGVWQPQQKIMITD